MLERLEGEDRRDYGRILLSMADDRYARTPGTSSMANGGENIRRRIEAIVRFKKYPRGMSLVSVCIALVLTVPLLAGQRAGAAQIQYQRRDRSDDLGCSAAMAAARTLRCTTYAGAFDAYAKAVLDWESPVFLTGGGWSGSGWEVPDSYAADLYLNGALAAQLALLPVEGDGYHG